MQVVKGLISGLLLITMSIAGRAAAEDISGAGATFPAPIYAKWAEMYQQAGLGRLNYQPIGSGGGIKQIKARTVDFGASDMPLSPTDLSAGGLFQFPTVIGGVVPMVNVPGVKAGEMKINGPVLAKLFLGQIKYWDDPEVAKLNPTLKLPRLAVQIVHRAEGSGTTFVFTSYLSIVSADWKSTVGAGTEVKWPMGSGGKGNDGVAGLVRQTPGAIGYVEYSFARPNHLAYVQMQTANGRFIDPNLASFGQAAAQADFKKVPGFAVALLNQPGASWPMTSPTYILLHLKQNNPANGAAVLKFFDWAYTNGDKAAADLDYVPLPASVKALVRKAWASQISGPDGKPVYVSK